jgi:hypothetical protein
VYTYISLHPFQRTERCDGEEAGKQITAVDGQNNSLCATLSISDEGILSYNAKENTKKIRRNREEINRG